MSVEKPYYRIYRPIKMRDAYLPDYKYVLDNSYAHNRLHLSRAYLNLERKLRDVFDYIEPCASNEAVFSFELYKILLMACTEVELNLKQILLANGGRNKDCSMRYYKEIEKSSKLSSYKVLFKNWRRNKKKNDYGDKIFIPFKSFERSKSPRWYVSYNNVKHDREGKFNGASLSYCMYSVAAVLVLLYSQFGAYCIETYGDNAPQWNDGCEPQMNARTMFEIIEFPHWTDEEMYDFNWGVIRHKNAIQEFPFFRRGQQ